jgi:hypothetical protein
MESLRKDPEKKALEPAFIAPIFGGDHLNNCTATINRRNLVITQPDLVAEQRMRLLCIVCLAPTRAPDRIIPARISNLIIPATFI